MFRVAWWLIVASAMYIPVRIAGYVIGLIDVGAIGERLIFYGVLFAVMAAYIRRDLGAPWAELVPVRRVALWLVVPVVFLHVGLFVLATQSVTLCEALNVLPPEVFGQLGGAASPASGNAPSLLGALVSRAVMPGVLEEVVFRGLVLYALAARMSKRRAIVISALCFAAWHQRIERMPDTLLAGLLYGWLFVRTGSLLPSMLAHTLHDAACVFFDRMNLWPGSANAWVGVDQYGLMPAWLVWLGAASTVAGALWIGWALKAPPNARSMSLNEDEGLQALAA